MTNPPKPPPPPPIQPDEQIKFCSRCGKPNPSSATACIDCGAQLPNL